jgi:chromate transporter
LAWAYVAFGSLPQSEWLLYGVKPVVIAVIANALWMLGRKAAKTVPLALVGLAMLVLYFLGVNEILLLAAGGLAVVLGSVLTKSERDSVRGILPVLGGLSLPSLTGLLSIPFSLSRLFLTFVKIGSVLYGSGYVLLAFLRSDFVVRFGWLTDQQLVDAIAIGQVTPGPVFTTATFIGYVLGGTPGALLATLGIFLPAFLFVAISSPLIPRIRNSVWGGALLDGVNAASLGLMAAVTIQLARASVVDLVTGVVALLSFVAIFRYKVNTTWLIAGGAAVGVLSQVVG